MKAGLLRSLLVVFILFGFPLTSQARAYVKSLKDFKTHTSVHIQNVNRLGLHLYQQYRHSHFQNVPEHILREKLLQHDFEKLADRQSLTAFGYDHSEPFSSRLFSQYGKKINDSEVIQDLVSDLSKFTSRVDFVFYRRHRLIKANGDLTEVGSKIAFIERIADLVEREKNPVAPEEFGVKKMKKANVFFTSPIDRALADELAKNYSQIVIPNPLLYIVSDNKANGTCSHVFLSL